MTTKLLIDRELLEELRDAANDCLNHAIMRGNDRNVPAYTELVEQADAALDAPRQSEGDAASILLPALRQYMHNDGSGLLAGYEYERTQQIVAELRQECERLRAEVENKYREPSKNELALEAERDTLRQQLAERDAQIARMRAEVTPFIETHWRPVAEQRDRLAELLEEWREMFDGGLASGQLGVLRRQTDAALAEIQNAQQPAPLTISTADIQSPSNKD